MHFLIQRHPRLFSLSNNMGELLNKIGHTYEFVFDLNKELVVKYESDIFILFYPEIYDYKFETGNIESIVIPKKYILFQLEQGIGFFKKPAFLQLLNNTDHILEFTVYNINKYAHLSNTLKYVYPNTPLPLSKLNKYIDIKSKAEQLYDTCEYDLIFYGSPNLRRQKILEQLQQKYNIHIFNGIVNEERDNIVKKGKILINLHYYDDNVLETCRFNEGIHCDKIIISENSVNDQFNYELYKDNVVFVDCIDNELSNINNLYEKIDHLLIKENFVNKFVENYHNKFIIKQNVESLFINNFNKVLKNITKSN